MTTKQLLASLTLTFLTTVTLTAQEERAPRLEVGAQFSSVTFVEPEAFPPPGQGQSRSRTEAGFGGRVTYNFNDSFAAEAEVNFFPRDEVAFNEYTDGRALQALFGVKAGRRFGKFGLFGKARPGLVRFGRAFSGTRPETGLEGQSLLIPEYAGRTNFALDVGGVMELYPSRRVLARFDLGDTVVRFTDLTYQLTIPPVAGPPSQTLFTNTLPGRTTHNFQFNAGIGVRF
jgi:Outer membrane protein beta-barrel domain